MDFLVCERFVSINGEGRRAGELSVFVRFKGCGLRCTYCDTAWANDPDVPAERMTADDICAYVKSTGVENVTLTGGEPLMRPGMDELLSKLNAAGFSVEVETNGAVDIRPYLRPGVRPDCFTLDYKLPGSGMEGAMLIENYEAVTSSDCVKFVAGSMADLKRAAEIIERFDLTNRCTVFISPVFGSIEPKDIVDFMAENKLNGVKLQIQLHKVIWSPETRGV